MKNLNIFCLKLAEILGFNNYAEYALKLLCAKSPENVAQFLDKLAEKMRVLQKKEMDILLEYKREDVNMIRLNIVFIK